MRKLVYVLGALVLLATAGCGTSGGDEAGSSTTAESGGATSTSGDSEPTTTAGTSSRDESDYADALATGLTSTGGSGKELELTATEAGCIAPEWVSVIGLKTITDTDLAPADLAAPDFAVSSLGLDIAQGKEMIDAFKTCKIDIYQRILGVLSANLDATKATCLEGRFDDKLAGQFLAESLTQQDLSSDLSDTLDAIDKACQLSAG